MRTASSEIAIRAEGLGKRYRIGTREPYRTLRETLPGLLSVPLRGLRRAVSPGGAAGARPREDEDYVWALKDVSFEVRRGEVVGVIGRNGAGKSTLLKILSRITEPTAGRADIYGRVGSLLEVGTGFHPELTGRENIYLSGALLGMKRQEIDRRFDEIVEFAEIGPFLDTPVKRYSSGMYVRLAFAVAAHLEPEILLVDEVLAVGDAAFQKKCLGEMGEVAKEGRTVLFVSHGMDAVRSLCPRTLWLDRGCVVADGDSSRIIGRYLDGLVGLHGVLDDHARRSNDPVIVRRVLLKDEGGRVTHRFPFGSPMTVEVHFHARRRVEEPRFWIGIGEGDSVFGAIGILDGIGPSWVEGDGVLRCTFDRLSLLPRFYNVYMGGRDSTNSHVILNTSCVAGFEVTGSPEDFGFRGGIADTVIKTCAPVFVPYCWELPDGRRIEIRGPESEGTGR